MKRKFRRSSDTYIPTQLTSSSSSSGRVGKKKRRNSFSSRRSSTTSSGGLTDYTSGGSVYSGSSGGRMIASTSGAVLGYTLMNVPGAVSGYKKAGELYDYVNSANSVSQRKSSGMFVGKFKKPKPYKVTANMKASTQGYLTSYEQYGTVTDPNAVYIYQSTYHSPQFGVAIMGSLIRKLFKKAGISVSDRDGSLGLFSPYNADGFKLDFQTYNPTVGSNVLYSYTTVAADTLTTVLNNSGFATVVTNYLNKAGDNPPITLTLYSSDRNGVDTNWRLCSNIDIGAEHFNIVSQSSIVVQNQTKSVGTSSDTDRIDAQPLSCAIYSFRNDPKIKTSGNVPSGSTRTELNKWQGVAYTGTRLLRAQDFVNTSFHEPPPTGIFSNITGKSFATLQPGNMKKAYITHTFKGKLVNIIPKMRMEQFGGSPILLQGVYCKTNLFCFQEKMRTNSLNPVIVAYEHHLSIGVTLTTHNPKVAIQTSFDAVEQNL